MYGTVFLRIRCQDGHHYPFVVGGTSTWGFLACTYDLISHSYSFKNSLSCSSLGFLNSSIFFIVSSNGPHASWTNADHAPASGIRSGESTKQNNTSLRRCSENNIRFQTIHRTSVSPNLFRKQHSIYIFCIFHCLHHV